LHEAAGLKRVIVSTYQSVSGAGKEALSELDSPQSGRSVFSRPIHGNVIPQIDVFLDNGYTKEEMKVRSESRKILHLPDLPVTCTAVRVPVRIGHSEAVTVEFERDFSPEDAVKVLSSQPFCMFSRLRKNSLFRVMLREKTRSLSGG